MTPEGPATGDEAADPQVDHLADHLHADQHIIAAPGDTEAPHHSMSIQSPLQDHPQHQPTVT